MVVAFPAVVTMLAPEWRLPSGASNYRVKTMRTDLDHLPANKQRELERVKQIIFEEFADSIALATMNWKKKGRIDKIILYGSYARGGWVDEPHTAKGYRSDFDLLITRQRQAADRKGRLLAESRGPAQPRAGDRQDAPYAGQFHRPHHPGSERRTRARALFLHGRRARWDRALRV